MTSEIPGLTGAREQTNGASVSVQLADGSTSVFSLQRVGALKVIRILDELGMKGLADIDRDAIGTARFMERIVCEAISTADNMWTTKRISESLASLGEVAKIYFKAMELSDLRSEIDQVRALAKKFGKVK